MNATRFLAVSVLACPGALCARAQLTIETVTVGNPGNPGEAQFDGTFGRVDYVYQIGRYEVTAGQYASFLSAVAADDPHGLYSPLMWTHEHGCKIERNGSPGGYTYSVAPDLADRPVNFVSFGDAIRFANWLHNGQPSGAQDLSTTEDGSYFLNGMTADWELEALVREPDATWVVPSEDEWYKAAYHANDGATGNYFNYPMSVDFGISNDLSDPDPGGHVTYYTHPDDFTIGAPYYRTEIGAHENSASPYGTFDQGGNVMEWNEAIPLFDGRGLRGGAYLFGSDLLGAWSRPIEYHSSDQFGDVGFRAGRIGAPACPGDLDGDAAVGLGDLSILLTNFGTTGGVTHEMGDMNGDGNVDLADLSALLSAFGTGCG